MDTIKRAWRRDFKYIGLRGRTEPNYSTGNIGKMYGSGAVVCPIDDWQRANNHSDFKRLALPHEKYALAAKFKWCNEKHGKSFGGYAETVEGGKRKCEEWLDECEREYAARKAR